MPSDPFDFSNADPNAAGFLGIAPSAWRDLAAFGGNLASAANARTASGHLANGTGFAGPLGAAIGPTMEFGRQNAVTRSNLGMQAANTRGRQIENMLLESSLPTQLARNKMLQDIFQDPAKLNQLMQQFGGGGGAPVGGFGGALAASESSGNPAATNSAGYSGQHQFGSERLADLGFYKPAQGENLKANQWAGQFAIPGFPEVKTQSDFLASQPAQNAAYHAHIQNIDQAIAQTPGAQGLDPNGLRAVAHLGGVHGMQQFVQTGGKYNPTDSNGTSLTDYYRKFSGAGAASPASGPRMSSRPPGSFQVAQSGNGPMAMPSQAASGFAPLTPIPGAPTVTQASQTRTPLPSQIGGGNYPPSIIPPGAYQGPQTQPPPQALEPPQQSASSGFNISPQEAMQRAEHYERQADILDRQISAADQASKLLGIPIARPEGDPAVKRAAASQFRQLSLAGPKTAAEAQAGLPAKLAEQGFQSGPNGQTFIPGGKADPAYVGAVKAAEAASSNVDIRPGGQVRIMGPNGPEWVKNPQVEKIQLQNGDIALVHVTPPPPGSPPGTKGESTPIVDQNGQQIIEKRTQLNEFNQKRGGLLAEQFDKIDHDAASAKEGNYLFDNMRNDAKGFQMGKFAEWEGNGRAWLSAIADKLGIETPELKNKLSDFESFRKSSGALLRTAVHDTSSRAAAQEYNMISDTLPHPTTSEQGFGQVADQWQSLYDFRLAKQKFASGYEGAPGKLNVDFNSQVSPTSFLLNRMAQTPTGQADMHAMLSRMSATPEGKLMAGRMLQQFEQTKKLGLFDDLSPTGSQQPAQAP